MATYAVPEIRNTCTHTPNLLLLKLLTFLKTGLCNTNLTVNMNQQSKLILSSSNNTNEKDKTCLDKGRSTSHSSEDYFKTNILQDPKLFLSGLYSEKHNYSRNKRAFIDLSLFHAKKNKTCRSVVDKDSQTEYYSMDKTHVVKPFIRKDNLHIKG